MANFYEDFVIKTCRTGSNYICNPPVTTTDIDTLILAKPGYETSLIQLGWTDSTPEGVTYDTQGAFVSWRKDNKNYIVTTDPKFYRKFEIATHTAKALNLKNKEDRVQLFQFIFTFSI